MTYQQHPLSAAFPRMTAEDFQALKDSIEQIGVQNPITIFEGMVVDGWNRYQAASELGMECPTSSLADWIDPREFVLAQNKARRHVTQAQLAMAATEVYAWKPVGNPSLSNSAGTAELSKTTKELAAIAGVGIRSIEQAKAIHSKAVPEVIAAAKQGVIGTEKAAAIAKLPQEQQAAAISKPAPKKPAKAKPAPVVEPEIEAPPEYTELDAVRDQLHEQRLHSEDLEAKLAVASMGDAPEESKQQAAELIAELRAEVKTLRATLSAANQSRDFYMEENAQMKTQMAMQRREIERLKPNK